MSGTLPAKRRLGLRGKLLGGLSLGLGLTVLASLSGLAVAWQRLGTEPPAEIVTDELVKTVEIDFRTQIQEWKNVLLRGSDPERLEEYMARFEASEKDVKTHAREAMARLPEGASHQAMDAFIATHAQMGEAYREALVAFSASGYDPIAGDAAVAGMDRAPGQKLAELSDLTSQAASAAVVANATQVRGIIETSIAITLLAMLSTLSAIWLWISRSVVGPIRQVVLSAQRVAHGELVLESTGKRHDEVGELQQAMNTMVTTLVEFRDAQQGLADRHVAGQVSSRIDAAAFSGAYADMARKINEVVALHVGLQSRMADVVGQYAKGDFSDALERLPGAQARITDAIDAVKLSMLDSNAEVRRLVEAAVAGDFSQRGDAARFEFAYRELIEELNRLMSATDEGLGQIGALLSAVAEGDLSRRVDAGLPGRFGEVAGDANRTVERLAEIVGQIRGGSDAINAAASEIAAGNDDLSRRTEQQAAALEETASSMEELTSTVRQNADNARQANELAIGAVGVASQGGEVVGRVVETMSAISESSNRIADIIGVIDGIAFQTNILALNAAVEAARAGEQGRGFAVVATEVRSLAQRSADAAKEIKTLITDSADKVRHGNELVDQAGRTMGEIVTSVKRVTDIIADISAASQEQSAGIEQVNQAITQMDEGTQQNAALVEEATAAARSMEQQAGQLVQTVAVFRVRDERPARSAKDRVPVAAQTPSSVVKLPTHKPAPARAKPAPHSRRTAAVAAAEAGGDWQEF
ncbi:methyl-accepting chemotaxis protein [Luteimonas sp. A611]